MKKVLTGGCFNILHPGHIYFLKKAKSYGDYLIVLLTNDFNNNKPYAKPYKERKENLRKLKIADLIIKGYKNKNFSNIIKKYNPNIIVLGYDQKFDRSFSMIKRLKKYKNYSSKNYGEV